MKIWDKGQPLNRQVEVFTVGNDRQLDQILAPYDILGSLAHARMLQKVGLLSSREHESIKKSLLTLLELAKSGKLSISEQVEDIHSEVEWRLIQQLGDTGKKLHTARSRNDQVLLDIHLMLREELFELAQLTKQLFDIMMARAEEFRSVKLPGYTHMQVAMPSTFGLWLGAFAESLADDMSLIHQAYYTIDQNPLGTAAGYGSSLPVDRELTTELLGFSRLYVVSTMAQISRGKKEWFLSNVLASLAMTLGKLANDCILYQSENYGFIKFDDAFTTGSSIMPHKRNPDVMELVRGRAARIKALPNELNMMVQNLPSGYHRDFQLIKEPLFPALTSMKEMLSIVSLMLKEMQVVDRSEEEKYMSMYSVERVNRLVEEGIPFREAYQRVGSDLKTDERTLPLGAYTHIGSIGNPRFDLIQDKFTQQYQSIDDTKWREAFLNLTS